MSVKQNLKRTLKAIESAKRKLRQAKNVAEVSSDVSSAERDLNDAEKYIKRVIRETRDLDSIS